MCCVDFNISLIDLGGPGCVRLNYISPEKGIMLNISYGDSVLHNQTVKGPDPEPTCLKVFTQLAQMCARFSELLPTDDGLRGCVQLEPMLLGEVQVELPLGCFRMGPDGMKMIKSSNDVIKEQQPTEEATTEKPKEPEVEAVTEVDKEPEAEDDSIAGLSTKEIIAVVNQSAEEGIALISNWLGLAVNKINKFNSTINALRDENNTIIPDEVVASKSTEVKI